MNKKYLVIAIIVLGAIAVAIVFLYNSASPRDYVFIPPLRLLSFASHGQVRATICEKANGPLFQNVCKEKFDLVAKDDVAKIDELFLALNQVQKDKKLSPYEKFLLGQLVFATLPNGSSQAVSHDRIFSWIANIANALGMKAYAQNVAISREQYEEHLAGDLASIIKNCPKPGDENWILTATCSEYAWAGNERQFIYSKQYVETGGPNWCNEQGEAGATEVYHAQSVINMKMRDEYNFSDSPNLSNQIACMFSCGSYPSALVAGEASGQKCDPTAKFNDFTEVGYSGEDLLKKILDKARNIQIPSQLDVDSPKDTAASQIKQQCWGASDSTLRECPQAGQPCRVSEVFSVPRMCVGDTSFVQFRCVFHAKSGPDYEKCVARQKDGTRCDYNQYLWEITEEVDCPAPRNACQNGHCVFP